ncbi:MAG: glycosyltransferase family 2 protein [Candidatus Methylomirabilis sp.]|nr:glycosyltransferase family 2 protein [Deltaproteobacteria bacterium]
MWKGNKVSVVIPAYNEEETIAAVVGAFKKNEYVDEVLVVNNNSKDRTDEEARSAGARVVLETNPGYGNALRRGMEDAEGEIMVLTEADGSFSAGDVVKFLAYIEDAGMVIGTRTTRQMLGQGARMNFIIRLANIGVAKLFELFWFFTNETRFSDVGCTYRALWKSTYRQIRAGLTATGPEFSPEMMAEVIRCRIKVIEIPVRYGPRLGGESQHSGTYFKLTRTALKMLRVLVRKKFGM